MDEKITFWASAVFGALALVTLVLNVSFVNGNRTLQDEVNQRQALINRGATYSQVNQSLVQALAGAAVKDGDTQARDLLAAQGITVKNQADAAAAEPKMAEKHKKPETPPEE